MHPALLSALGQGPEGLMWALGADDGLRGLGELRK